MSVRALHPRHTTQPLLAAAPGDLGLARGLPCPSLTPPPKNPLNMPDVLGPHHARAELTYGAVWMR